MRPGWPGALWVCTDAFWRSLDALGRYLLQIIPHDFGFRKMREFVIRDTQTLKKKIEMVEALADIALATKLLKQGDLDKNPIDESYECVTSHCGLPACRMCRGTHQPCRSQEAAMRPGAAA